MAAETPDRLPPQPATLGRFRTEANRLAGWRALTHNATPYLVRTPDEGDKVVEATATRGGLLRRVRYADIRVRDHESISTEGLDVFPYTRYSWHKEGFTLIETGYLGRPSNSNQDPKPVERTQIDLLHGVAERMSGATVATEGDFKRVTALITAIDRRRDRLGYGFGELPDGNPKTRAERKAARRNQSRNS